MTNHSLLLLALVTAACAADPAPRPLKVFDFSGGSLDAPLPAAPPAGALGKAAIRYAIVGAQPRIRACAAALGGDPTGTLEVRLQLVGEPGAPTAVDAVELGGTSPLARGATACITAALEAIELPAMAAAEQWDVHYPIAVTR